MKKILYLSLLLLIMFGCVPLDEQAENGQENMKKEVVYKVNNINSTFEIGETIYHRGATFTGPSITYRFGGFINDGYFNIILHEGKNSSIGQVLNFNYSLDNTGFYLPNLENNSSLKLKVTNYDVEKNTITFESEGKFK